MMSKRVNISISDSIYERLEKVKSTINVSGVCQDCLIRVIEIEELKNQTGELDILIQKLSSEKRAIMEVCKTLGIQHGLKNAEKLSYGNFKYIEKHNYPDNETYQWILDLLGDIDEDEDGFDEDLYIEGWVEGALHIWDSVKNKL